MHKWWTPILTAVGILMALSSSSVAETRSNVLYDYVDGLIETKNITNSLPRVVERLTAQFASVAGLVGARKPKAAATESQSVATSTTVSFEQFKAGRFDTLETKLGAWTPTTGTTIVDDKHAKTGNNCLQLTGGKRTSITLDIADDADTTGELNFWAERWTKRKPFSFRIEKNSGDGWKQVLSGDEEVRVGRAFLSHVIVPLGDDSIEQLRFTVTSPPNTGILIDDVRLAPAVPQKIVSVEVVPLTLPTLVGTDASPLLKLKIETTGSLSPISLTELRGKIEGAANVKSLYVSTSERGASAPLRITSTSSSPSWKLAPLKLSDGENYVWVGCKLKKDANIDDRVGATVTEVTFSNGKTIKIDALGSSQRMGIAVRQGGDDGVNRYRIPGLATTNRGTLIGVYDVRRRSGGDLPGDIDVGMSRSADGGRTWDPMQVIMDMGDDPEWNHDGIGGGFNSWCIHHSSIESNHSMARSLPCGSNS